MADLLQQKYSQAEIRAAKRRSEATARRPPPVKIAPRTSRLKPIAIVLAASLVTAGGAFLWCRHAWDEALAGARLLAREGLPARTATLATDRELRSVLAVFKPPEKHEWTEIEATANLRRTGNAKARKLAGENAELLEKFRLAYNTPADSVRELFGRDRALLNDRYDLDQLRVLLVSCAAMGHYLIESGSALEGESVLLAVLRAGQMVSRGTEGQPSFRALSTGLEACSMARLLLLSHTFQGTLSVETRKRLGGDMKEALALEPDVRYSVVGDRDRALAMVEHVREKLGVWWGWLDLAGYGDPAQQLASVYEGIQNGLERKVPDLARADVSASLARLAADDVHELARVAGPGATFHDTWLRNRTTALGAVTAAYLIDRLAAEPVLPERVSHQMYGLPKDPVSDQPFRYESLGESFRLYGVGPDNKDDGGDERQDVLLLGPPG